MIRDQGYMQLGAFGVWLVFGHFVAAGLALLLGLYLLKVDRDKFVIEHDGEKYLTRYHLIRCKACRVFLHRIHRPDQDRHLHNHPWPRAWGLILRGGYTEIRNLREPFKGRYWFAMNYDRGDINHLYPDTYHRITLVDENTWTLFFAGRRSRDWGFLIDGKHVDWRTYLDLPADADLGD